MLAVLCTLGLPSESGLYCVDLNGDELFCCCSLESLSMSGARPPIEVGIC